MRYYWSFKNNNRLLIKLKITLIISCQKFHWRIYVVRVNVIMVKKLKINIYFVWKFIICISLYKIIFCINFI